MLKLVPIRVNYIGYLRKITGVSCEVFDVFDVRDASLSTILGLITTKYPTLSLNILRCAINQKLIRPTDYAATIVSWDSSLKILIATSGG